MHRATAGLVTRCATPCSRRALHASASRRLDSPLAGVRVLEIASGPSASLAALLLADLGADVIKIEKPKVGCPIRRWAPFAPSIDPSKPAESTLFLTQNRNKRSVTADLTRYEGVDLAHKLVSTADVLISDTLLDDATRLQIDPATASGINPRIIYTSVTGFGLSGPLSGTPSLDGTIAAAAGVLFCTGEPGRAPVRPQTTISDNTAAYNAFVAVLGALYGRKTQAKSVTIDVSSFDTQVAALGSVSAAYLNGGIEYTRVGSSHPTMVPYQMFATADGQLTIGTGNDTQYKKVCQAMGVAHLGSDPRYATNRLRVENRDTLVPALSAILESKSTDHWMKHFKNQGFPHGRISNMKQVFSHPQVKPRALVATVPHPSIGSSFMVAPAVLYDGERMKIERCAPLLGQHNGEVYGSELGLSDEELERSDYQVAMQQ